ncbi:tRNA pseudouridine(38-40) synthase TruA [Methanobacterium ferruginis]|uniref:tRNA pseudouridine(38-40) synthase TruA n=1 Tax=Methanobacterium ferruginis TaxID=710191 RepID=UPI0025742E70|nr:tRNA pseudouridine(38-40) synthase TruA [Methanobacterium ferruginis]BDZ68306.1 tRNA pseudouridine(38-40) synthase TruA [Methanobacterium ferruginis]
MRKVALKLAYLGTEFYGFQRQPNLRTVEGKLLEALQKVGLINNLGQANYSLAGRTDRGVHALGNVVSFRTDQELIINQINDLLPQDMRILGSARVPLGFKARYAHKRHYRYVLAKPPLEEEWETDKMEEAACLMEGTHNFLNFSRRNERNPIRRVDTVKITPHNQVYLVDVVGESFLWNMVRKMVAVLLSVGKDELEVEDVQKFLDPQYKAAISPLPPESLILMDVFYQGLQFKEDEYACSRFLQALNDECYNHQRMVASTEEMIRTLSSD